jgi:hypothetical protein
MCWPRGTLYPEKLELTSPTSGGRSVGTVHLRTKAKLFEYFLVFYNNYKHKLYALTGCPLQEGTFLVLSSVRGWVDSIFIMRLEGLGQFKNPMSSKGIEPATFLLVAQWLNKLWHCTGQQVSSKRWHFSERLESSGHTYRREDLKSQTHTSIIN